MNDPIVSERQPAVPIRRLAPRNILSFGSAYPGLELGALNVLIGPNGCGKSNLIETVNLMRSAPRDLRDTTRKGGGVTEWIWKGNPDALATVEWVLRNPLPSEDGREAIALRHEIGFRAVSQAFVLEHECVEEIEPRRTNTTDSTDSTDVRFHYRYRDGQAFVGENGGGKRSLPPDTVEPSRSALAYRRDPEFHPALAHLANLYERIRIYREWAFGRSAVFREPQKADMRNDALEEDFSNLGLFLNRLKTRFPAAKRSLLENLRQLYDGLMDFEVFVEGGTVQVFFAERGSPAVKDFSIPATRLSDGTLRYLCLLAILCDPEPPPLVCIEEPELGLHPDILPTLADLLREASQRTQLIVTTHSDILVDAMTETPEAVVVCEKHDGATEMRRLAPEELAVWLKDYRLGQLWIDGQLGGKRW